LLSNCTAAAPAVSASPLLLTAPEIHPCTVAVTSNITNVSAALTCAVWIAVPSDGMLA
jgi:hypothetical protein